jgi:hypothetical protein
VYAYRHISTLFYTERQASVAAPTKATLPSEERAVLQALIRAGLQQIGLTQAEWATEVVALLPITAPTKSERDTERARSREKVYSFIRTHLKSTDPHFTPRTAHRLMTWFIRTLEPKIEAIEDDFGEAYYIALNVDGRASLQGQYVDLVCLHDEWLDSVYDLVPSVRDWFTEHIRWNTLAPRSADLLAAYLTKTLKTCGLVSPKKVSSYTRALTEALGKREIGWGSYNGELTVALDGAWAMDKIYAEK